MTYTKNMVV